MAFLGIVLTILLIGYIFYGLVDGIVDIYYKVKYYRKKESESNGSSK